MNWSITHYKTTENKVSNRGRIPEKMMLRRRYLSMRKRFRNTFSQLTKGAVMNEIPSGQSIQNILNYAKATVVIPIMEDRFQVIVLN